MLKEQAGNVIERPYQATGKYLEHQSCENAREVYQTLQSSGLDKFTYSLIDSLLQTLTGVVHHLERLPEAQFKELIEVIDGLGEARSELRLARFLFEVEEINPVHRLILRNKAVLRGRDILQRMLQVWPASGSR